MTTYSNMDAAIMSGATYGPTGRDAAFSRMIEEFGPALQRLTSGYASSDADREDLYQDVMAGVWNALPAFRGASSERTWVYRIAHNVAISWSMRQNARRRREQPLGEIEPAQNRSPESLAIDAQRRQMLISAIRALDGHDKQIVLLHLEGLSYADITEVVGIKEGAVATRLTRIRKRLTDAIASRGRA
jgi:RNA polymerase sigma-70 factor, ECF subfamily